MKNITKKIFVGGTIALALLTPTIIATEKFGDVKNDFLIEKEIKSEPSSSAEQIEVHVSDDGDGHGSEKVHYEADLLHKYRSSYYYTDGNEASIKSISNLSMDIKFEIDKDGGIYLPRIENYKDDNTLTPTDDHDYELLFVPTVIVEKGQQAVINFASIPNITKQSYDSYASSDYFYSQNYDGETGVSFVLKDLGYDSTEIVEPIIFHLTWDDSLNNGSKMGKSSIYYDNLKDDYVDLNFKTKTLDVTKAYGMSELYDFKIRAFSSIGSFYANDILNGDRVKYYSNFYENSLYNMFLLNSISNTINFKSIDLSDENIELQLNRVFNSDYAYKNFDIDFPVFYTIKPLDELLTTEEYSSFETIWNSGGNINDFNTDELDSIVNTNTAFNNEYFVGNEEFNIITSISNLFIRDGKLYAAEKIKIDFDRDVQTSDLFLYESATKEVANFLKGGVLEQIVDSSFFWLGSRDQHYSGYTSLGYVRPFTGYSILVYNVDESANFMTNPQWVLILFSILSIIGLIIVIIILIRSSNKEESGIEIAGGVE